MERTESVGQSWGIPMTMGVLMIIAGIFAVVASQLSGFVSAVFIGAVLVVTGVLEIVTAVRVRRSGPWLMFLLAGVLAIVVGALFLLRPLAGMASLTLLIASYLFASGLFRGITSIADRYRGWGWDFAYGVLAVVLGVYVVASWPSSSLWVLGTVVGAEIAARGLALTAASWTLRDIEHGAPHALR
jgi:uncharacterized membrane protein HdeD (DUF308 family)